MSRKAEADAIFQREVWAKIDAMLPQGFAGRDRQSSCLGAEAAIYGMSLLANMMGSLLRKPPADHGDIEPRVIEALARDPKAASKVIADWQKAMTSLSGFVRDVLVRVGRDHDGAVLLLKVLHAVDRTKLHPAEAGFAERVFRAAAYGEMLRPNSDSESIVLHLGDATAEAVDAMSAVERGARKEATAAFAGRKEPGRRFKERKPKGKR